MSALVTDSPSLSWEMKVGVASYETTLSPSTLPPPPPNLNVDRRGGGTGGRDYDIIISQHPYGPTLKLEGKGGGGSGGRKAGLSSMS